MKLLRPQVLPVFGEDRIDEFTKSDGDCLEDHKLSIGTRTSSSPTVFSTKITMRRTLFYLNIFVSE